MVPASRSLALRPSAAITRDGLLPALRLGMESMLIDLTREIRWADLVDILLVAAFFYVGITWLRRSSSGSAARRIMALGLVLALVYLLSDLVHLYLVRQLLQVLSIGFLIAAVVVFQTDIRRLLDRLASWGDGGERRVTGGSAVETLIEVANRLAEERIGAIIALQGRDAWDPHVQGGVELDGVVSRPLLESIFQPESPGHDGAVLMEGERVVRFGTHLPLAAHIPEVSRFGGTRHAAALGLADETDAFVIVVSEERGSISIARDGKLREVDSLSELANGLGAFWEEHYGDDGGARRGTRSREAIESAGMSLLFASLVWLLFSYSADTISRTFEAPIEFRNLPEEWTLDSDTVPSALVTLSGSERAFAALDGPQLAVSFDLADAGAGANVLTVTGENLNLPPGLRLANVNPRQITVSVRPQRTVEVPVRIRTMGPLPDSVLLVAQPRAVALVLSSGAPEPESIATAPLDLAEILRDGSATVGLDLPPDTELAPGQTREVTVFTRRPGISPSR